MSSQTELPFALPQHGDPLICLICESLIENCNYSAPYGIFTCYDKETEDESEVLIGMSDGRCTISVLHDTEHPLIRDVVEIHKCGI